MEIDDLYRKFTESTGGVTDTRKELSGKMFFALKGPNFNGNRYASKAIAGGAKFAIVDEEEFADQESIFLVKDVLSSLQYLAALHKQRVGVPVIGITGTNGKTTNKELLYHILSKKYGCYCTKGNLNNHIGVPLSLLEVNSSHEFAIIEMGANKLGDIRELCEIADPDYGYITNIGVAHLEGFGSKQNIRKEKGELFRYVQKKRGVFFVNTSESDVVEISEGYSENVLIGERDVDLYKFDLKASIPEVILTLKNDLFVSHLYGRHNYENLKMAIGIGIYFEVAVDLVKAALSEYTPTNNRSQILRKDGLVIFMDAYNANPSSMKSSIQSFADFDAVEKYLILGDMLEMGEHASNEHEGIIEFIHAFKWKTVVLIGENFGQFQDKYKEYYFFESTSAANEFLNKPFPKGTHILLKGSRGQALEKLQFIQQLQ